MTKELFNGLIAKAKENDQRAICIFSDFCIKAIKSHLDKKFDNIQDSEDFAHDIFTYKIYSNLPTEPVEYPYAWLYIIADRYMFTYLENHNTTLEYNENAYPDEFFENHVNKFMIDEAFAIIDEVTCQILVLNNIYGYTYEEIAPMVNLSPEAVRQRACRVKLNKKLLSHFGKK
ncbi:MAG: sigma-70 family RNA polymerase sigma factor [Clostridia bacterium]|nr:sigma-70 family RNA polymerase sigma factor [Clostridia bacterium]